MWPNGGVVWSGWQSGGPGGRNMDCNNESPMLMTTPLPPELPLPFHPRSCSQGPLPESQYPLPPAFQSGWSDHAPLPCQLEVDQSAPLLLLGPYVQAMGEDFPLSKEVKTPDSAVSMMCICLMSGVIRHVTKLCLLSSLPITGYHNRSP